MYVLRIYFCKIVLIKLRVVIISFELTTYFVKLVFFLTSLHCMSLGVILSINLVVTQSSLKHVLPLFTVSHFLNEIFQDNILKTFSSQVTYKYVVSDMSAKIPVELHI